MSNDVILKYQLPKDTHKFKCVLRSRELASLIESIEVMCIQQLKYDKSKWDNKSPLEAFRYIRKYLRDSAKDHDVYDLLFN